MMKLSFLHVSVLAFVLALTPVAAFAKNTKTSPAVTVPVAPAAPSVDVSAAPAAPVADTAAKPAEKTVENITVGDLTLSHAALAPAKGNVDLFVTIKNNGKIDEKITGIGTSWQTGDAVQLKKNKDGSEQETLVGLDIPAGKSVELSTDESWLRFKDVNQPANVTVMPVSFYFRHAPNANLQLPLNGKVGTSIWDWFKK